MGLLYLPYKLIFPACALNYSAFIDIQEEYAENAVEHLHGSLFYGKEIKVAYSKKAHTQERLAKRKREADRPRGDYRDSRDRESYPRDTFPGVGSSQRFVIDDFSQEPVLPDKL